MGTSKGYIPPKNAEWKTAKRAVTSMMNNTNTYEGTSKAVSNFSKAYLSTHINNSSISKTLSNIIGFFHDVQSNGLDNTLTSLGFDNLANKNTEEVYIALIDYFCESNSSIDESILSECCMDIFKEYGIIDLDNISQIDSSEFIFRFIVKFIQLNFATAFAEKIQGLSKSVTECNENIKRSYDFIENVLVANYSQEDICNINWKSEQGQSFIKQQCKNCFEILSEYMED